jgi:hypothetical protein
MNCRYRFNDAVAIKEHTIACGNLTVRKIGDIAVNAYYGFH